MPFALLYLVEPDGGSARLVASSGVEDAADDFYPPVVQLDDTNSQWPLGVARTTGQAQIVDNLSARFKSAPSGPWSDPPHTAIVLPLASNVARQPSGFLVAGVSARIALDESYKDFFQVAIGPVATAIANARAYEVERRRAEALAELDRAKTAFFSNVSHEFRTPLTLMLGPLENLLVRKAAFAPHERAQLDTAHRNSLRLLKLVNTLLDFSRIEAGRLKATFRPVDLAALTTDISANFRSAMHAADLTLTVDCPPLPAPVYADAEMWEKIVLNLLSNAFKFTFTGGVTVRLRAQDGNAVLAISDSGTGIPAAELPHIFERFHRVEGAKGRSFEGSGIGLALVRELATVHGGSVIAQSRAGEGSTFTVSLPLGRAHLPADQISDGQASPVVTLPRQAWLLDGINRRIDDSPEPASLDAGTRPRVLMVDDNADMREHVRNILSDLYALETAANGEVALSLILKNPPDLLLTDIMMPGMDGFQLLHAVRSDPSVRPLPVIFLSARAGEEASIEGIGAGADDYLVKPFTARELQTRVGTHIAMARARRVAVVREAELRAAAESSRDEAVAVLESITDAYIALDSEWRLTYVNAEAERVNNMRREDMLGRSHWELYPDSVGTTVHKELLRCAAQRVPVEFENHYAPWDRWFHVKAYPASTGGLSVFYSDITTRKRADRVVTDLIGQAPFGIYVIDSAFRIAQMNVGSQNGAFRNVRPLIGRDFGEAVRILWPEAVAAEIIALFRHTLETGEAYRSRDFIRERGDVEAVEAYEWELHRLKLANGEYGVVCYYFDSTELRNTETALRASEERLRLATDHAEVGFWDVDVVNDILIWPSRVRAMFGISADAPVSMSDFYSGLHPEDRAAISEAYAAAVDPDRRDLYDVEYRTVGKEDNVIRWVAAKGRGVFNQQGQCIRVIGTAMDITRRKATEARLAESEERYRALAEQVTDGIFIADTQGHYVDANGAAAAMLGYSLDELLKLSLLDVLVPGEMEKLTQQLDRLVASDVVQGDLRFRRRNGSQFVGDMIVRQLPDGRLQGVVRDVTGRREVEDELRRANADLEQFAWSASHDLQEPLRSISIYSELLETRCRGKLDEQALEFLGYLRGGASRMELLVRDLLAYTQVTKLDTPLEEADANAVLKTVLSNLSEAISHGNAQVTSGSLPVLNIHGIHLNQLFQNLIGNALKYCSSETPVVRLEAERQGDEWLFSVHDNGIGIDPKYKERVFGLFKRLHSGDEYSGTGLGLAICQRIVERYHGRIWVESELGKGATFYFTLPALDQG